jgi:hypothetical protein
LRGINRFIAHAVCVVILSFLPLIAKEDLLHIKGDYLAFSYDFNQLYGEKVQWKRYDPDGRLVRDTAQFDTLVNTREDFIMVQTLYDELDLTQIKKPLKGGVWTVVFYLENLLVGSMNFTLKNQAGKKRVSSPERKSPDI